MIVVEEIGRHDLEIIPRRVRERASAKAVSFWTLGWRLCCFEEAVRALIAGFDPDQC
jgi:hypothetical protein